ncbi:hypothetical protein [Amycolatopsis australiensis]|uniref:hypothetical protein n=1 Tax=Amycolatopsis australiensis TaxID=546364 RepID=UPI001161120E|nr:hypothetical protein [Amycolatopsis australiensis]
MVASNSDPRPRLDIANTMIERGLSAGPPGRVLAMTLVELTMQHLQNETTPDPYGKFAQHLVRLGVCTELDLAAAFTGRALNSGLAQGWLPAEVYDQLAAFDGGDPTILEMLAQIERRA